MAGSFLRYRCCIYYSVLAAGLLEERYGHPGHVPDDAPARSPYGPMARWLLETAVTAGPTASALAAQLRTQASSDAGYHLTRLREAAGRLPAPLGRYSARLTLRGVTGTLWRCEISTVHTYLLFVADDHLAEDVYVDVTHKQFLLLPEWMEPRHFQACKSLGLFSELRDAFVGTASELAALMTLPALKAALGAVFAATGDRDARLEDNMESWTAANAGDHAYAQASPLRSGELDRMHLLRAEGLFAITEARKRHRMCGTPSQ